MNKGKADKAERLALNEFDKWNDVTGFVPEHTGYYYELQSVIEDAVHIGIQMALYGKVKYKKTGEVAREKLSPDINKIIERKVIEKKLMKLILKLHSMISLSKKPETQDAYGYAITELHDLINDINNY